MALQGKVHSQYVCKWYALLASCLLAASLAGCGSSSNINDVQVSISPTMASVYENQTQTFTASVTVTPYQNVTWSVQEGSAGGSVVGGVYTAPSTTGTFHVVATSVVYPSKSAVATVTVSAAAPPVFSSTPPTTGSEGQAYSYSIAATDPLGGTVSYSLTTGPGNATISGSTLTWTPTHAQSRTANAFTITATTSEGGTAEQNFSVTPNGTINGINTVIG